MLENKTTETRDNALKLMDTQEAVDCIEDYTNKMFKIAQLISEDFFSHYQGEREKNGLFDQNTMMGITHDFTGNNTLFEIILDYLGKISNVAETAGNTLRDIRQAQPESVTV